jgi:hypothetical protein
MSRLPRDVGRGQRLKLIGLALLFFGPLGLAFYLYYGPIGWRPPGHVNHGDLIDPPRPLPELRLPIESAAATKSLTAPDFLKHKWTLLYLGPGDCPERCRAELFKTRQVRISLNRDMDRVRRIFIAQGACCDFAYLGAEQRDLLVLSATEDAAPLLRLLPAADAASGFAPDRVYLVDPLGNLMMSYKPDAPPRGMLEDLKRLLGLSHVG